jgi:glycosyltransferase involved in cell wall biosynthesis
MSETANLSKELDRAKSALIVDCERKELAKGIEKLLNNPQLRSQLSTNGKSLVRERYTSEKSAKQMYKVYTSIIRRL